MSQSIKFDWTLTAEELTNCVAGTALAEQLIHELSREPEYILRPDIASIFHSIISKGHLHTEAAKGFISKMNFAIRQYQYTE